MITTTVQSHDFWQWLKTSGSYSNNFSLEGARALFDYLEQLSDETGTNIEYDPVAWCCTYTEYEDFKQFQHDTSYIQDGIEHMGYPEIKNLEDLAEHTMVVSESPLVVLDLGRIF